MRRQKPFGQRRARPGQAGYEQRARSLHPRRGQRVQRSAIEALDDALHEGIVPLGIERLQAALQVRRGGNGVERGVELADVPFRLADRITDP